MQKLLCTCALLTLFACSAATEQEEEMPSMEGTTLSSAEYAERVMMGQWASDITFAIDGDTLMVSDDGLPNHDYLEKYAVPDGTTTSVLTTEYTLAIPLNPVLAATKTDTNLGAIGVAISGGQFFNPYEGGGTLALEGNFEADGLPFIDTCNGHPLGTGSSYHYHGIPYCITDIVDQDGEHSSIIGLLLDGFPVYGGQDAGGMPPMDLDECNGHTGVTPEFPEGVYHYHTTETAPYSIPCYSGEVEASQGMMGPPGGGPPGGGPPR